jgi:Transcription factor WhiB
MTDWNEARCIGQTDLFFDERPIYEERAKEICSVCPIKRDCLMESFRNLDVYGIWGGQNLEERRMTAVMLGIKPPSRVEDIEHGTKKGYDWHKRTHTPIEYDEEGRDICGCQTAYRNDARERMAIYRKRVRAREVPRED